MDEKELQSLLFEAVQHHNDTLLDDLLDGEDGAKLLDVPGQDGNMLLHVAVMENDLRCIECLLKHGADPNVFDTIRARTPLHLSVELGQTDIVKTFLELDHINIDLRDDRNLTCHEIAQFCDNQNLADIIRNRQEEIEQLKNDFYSVMNQACSSNEPALVRELLGRYEKRFIEKLPKGWHPNKDGQLFARSSLKELINWSSSSWNDVTLLFKSSSLGHTEICRLLIEFGATAKCNENTNYSPLYVAAYGGFTNTVRLLLESFPSLVREITIEKWTVLHACCLQGHSETAKLILNYPYPESLKNRYVSRSGLYEYYFAFDLNAQDAAGQTVIYLSVYANNERLLDTLLQFNVEAKLLDQSTQANDLRQTGEGRRKYAQDKAALGVGRARIIPDRPKAVTSSDTGVRFHPNNQLDKILKQLKKFESNNSDLDNNDSSSNVQKDDDKYLICPFEMDTYCDYNSKTALHLAVCQQYHTMATTLLVNGSNPNLPILSRDSIKNDFTNSNIDIGLNWLRSSKSTCLKEACRLNDEFMCDILIRYGASDNQDNLALQVAAMNKNNPLISKFLSLKSNVDPEYKINKKCNVEFASRFKQSQKLSKSSHGSVTTTFSSMFPSIPVMIDWQNLKCIKQIDPQWLIEASLMHNKKLKHPTNSLMAITRLDLSSNNLKTIHPVIFRLPSLRELNLSKNRLESLFDLNQRNSNDGDPAVPTTKLIESLRTAMKRSKSSNLSSINLENSNLIDLNEPQEWDLPYLETLDLHDNLLICLPDCLFQLPRLQELDVSSNQIRQFPWAIWTAPSLRELIASGNLLDDLPKMPTLPRLSPTPRLDIISDSPTDDNASLEKIDNSFGGSSTIESESNKELSKHYSLNLQDFMDTQLTSSSEPVRHLNHWKKTIDLVSDANLELKTSDDSNDDQGDSQTISKITYLNLSHNSFTSIPPVLACITRKLVRLNLSHNRISSLGDISLYPLKLKSLDLSNNQITSWFLTDKQDYDTKHCYAENVRKVSTSKLLRTQSALLGCPHKLHHQLDYLKSINLGHNMIREIELTYQHETSDKRDRKSASCKNQLLYPNLTALDICFNKIQQVPKDMSRLKDLSVLNLSGNYNITSLPAELGLATKLWNLGINGCNLGEPLKSIVESKTYKTMDVIGYLRSILEEAKPYARMKLMLVGLQGIGKTSLLEQMRHEGSTGSRRRAPEHWTRRMGHTSRSNLRNQKGVTLSTVGVDIHDWIFCKRTSRNQPSFGPVSFSTWDFGGQEEFYATHRYFLSKRSMYLVVWRLTDGLNGILGIQQWLVNIQSRASGSPVIIVGTHEDMIEGGERGEKVQELQAEVHRRFINVSDQDKCGLPRVMDSIVVSTKTKLNIKNLCNRIYDVVFSLRCPGSTERLLEQKIPATYLYLEEIVSWIVHERYQKKREPVLNYEEYRKITSEHLKTKYNKVFRDLEPLNSRGINYNSELQQATRFLHENGILLHYEDANLRDLYFLDPQWLCDILSHVVTIREINPHVKNGLMKIDDLGFLFKSIDVNLNGGIQSYVVNLLNKFEVALTWNSQYLLIPSLLPSHPDSMNEQQNFQVKMAPRARGRSAVRRYEPNRNALRSTSIEPNRAGNMRRASTTNLGAGNFFEFEYQPDKVMHRLVMLRYLPAGFFARLQSALLSDPLFDDICADIHSHFVQEISEELKSNEIFGNRAGWTCWKTGIRLNLLKESTINTRIESNSIAPCLLSIQEFSTTSKDSLMSQKNFKIENVQLGTNMKADQSDGTTVDIVSSKWCNFEMSEYSNIIMITVPKLQFKITNKEDRSVNYVDADHASISKLLSNAVDHIDNLLEDWYPSLGARFAHTLGGNYLVTRILPCPRCSSLMLTPSVGGARNVDQRSSRFDVRSARHSNRVNFTITPASTRQGIKLDPAIDASTLCDGPDIYCYYVEHCILNAYNLIASSLNNLNPMRISPNTTQQPNQKWRSKVRNLHCPKHGTIAMVSVAPDIVFDDISDTYKIENNQIERCKLIGRGTFGFVFRGSLHSSLVFNQIDPTNQEVALKLLQPVDPGPEADHTDVVAYNSAKSNWTREPFHCACKSYCTARHEVNLLQNLSHPNIVNFIGLCIKPLAIVLELAPLGSLTDVFKNYKRANMHIDQYSVQKTILQVGRALEFLHQQRIIYRDLKAENVLVWSFPSPFSTQPHSSVVELKLADYGISRQALSTGTWKGFAGTINFLAPEILRHNGDEEYTEKVDCFSFGMFMYELLTLRPPHKHNEGMRNHLSEGGRPTLAERDLIYPSYIIDLMSTCWSQEPHYRPTASQIVSIASTPEFMKLLDVAALDQCESFQFCSALQYDNQELDLWLGVPSGVKIVTVNQGQWIECQTMENADKDSPFGLAPLECMCLVGDTIWLCDSRSYVHLMVTGSRLQDHELSLLNDTISNHYLDQSQHELNSIKSFTLNFDDPQASPQPIVKQMIFAESASCVMLLLSDGTLWSCQLSSMRCELLDNGSMKFNCMSTRDNHVTDGNHSKFGSSEKSFWLYCGQANGISCLEICENEVIRQSILPLAGKTLDEDGERIVEPSQTSEVTSIIASSSLLWTSAGCTVHLWNIDEKIVVRKLDCWKLVPCSESLESINIEQYHEQARSSKVSTMVHSSGQLFVGTTHGCFIVIEADTLKPMMVFRPYESDMIILNPISTTNKERTEGSGVEHNKHLVTLGRGYRDLMKRYLNTSEDVATDPQDLVAILWSASSMQALV